MKDFRDKPISHYMEDDIKQMTNKSLEFVKDYCMKKGWPIRIVRQDGRDCGITDDLKIFRLNIVVENNIVTELTCG